MTLLEILVLYLVFRAKHIICDFLLQTTWMAIGKGKNLLHGGAPPLLVHAGIHGVGTLLVVLIYAPQLWWLGLVDFAVHGAIDKTKALIVNKKGWTYNDTFWWWAFGIDQEAHNLTHLVYIVVLVLSSGAVLQ